MLRESPLPECPECDAARVRKLISPVAFRLKGGGWYETDFKSDNKRNVVESGAQADKPKDSVDGDKKKDGDATTTEGGSSDPKPGATSSTESSGSSKPEANPAQSG